MKQQRRTTKPSPSPSPNPRNASSRARLLSPTLLSGELALPEVDKEGDKEARGRVLVVGGGREMPGAVILSATAALRAGAGKMQIATARSVAQAVGVEVPEARVFALPETVSGAISVGAASIVVERAGKSQAVVVGPGMIDEEAITRLMKRIVGGIEQATLVVDANALDALADNPTLLHALEGRAIITPHAEEMAVVCGSDKEQVEGDPFGVAREAARRLRAVVVLKGRETFIVAPTGEAYLNRAGNVGLATSGSGDTLAGIITGLAARGAEPLQAAAWGVYLHALAGERLARRLGLLGYLAREIPAVVPGLLMELSDKGKRRG